MVEKFDWLESQQDAEELLAEFGHTGAIPRTVIAPPPNNWTPGEETTTYHPITVFVWPVDESRVDGTTILAGDWQALISTDGLTITPEIADIVMAEGAFVEDEYVGQSWVIAHIKPYGQGGVRVMYECVVRR